MKPRIQLRLFVSNHSRAAVNAIANLKAVCDDPAVKRNHEIDLEIIDVNASPQIAEEEKILVTPTLLKTLPLPVRRVVGDLSNEEDILVMLDIHTPRGAAPEADGGSA